MKPSRPPPVIDRVAAALLRNPRAVPLLTSNETIACGLNYAMMFEFWKYEITEALRIEGYKIEPMEREDYESRNH